MEQLIDSDCEQVPRCVGRGGPIDKSRFAADCRRGWPILGQIECIGEFSGTFVSAPRYGDCNAASFDLATLQSAK